MLEIPEAAVAARQLNNTVAAKTIRRVVAAQNPHKFAFYFGDPAAYPALLRWKTVGTSTSLGGMVEIVIDDVRLLFGDGVNLRYHQSPDDWPQKHQLLVEFNDTTALSATIAMYGGLWCYPQGVNDNPYYLAGRDKPSPLTQDFSAGYFGRLLHSDTENMPVKGFLATQQRIPGLGNGVLQDILYRARIHPKRKMGSLNEKDRQSLFESIKTVLGKMTERGGRNTEKDLFGNPGGYQTCMSKNTSGQPCPVCGEKIQKQNFLGGSIYFCPGCQREY